MQSNRRRQYWSPDAGQDGVEWGLRAREVTTRNSYTSKNCHANNTCTVIHQLIIIQSWMYQYYFFPSLWHSSCL